jgi:hypothetical protein
LVLRRQQRQAQVAVKARVSAKRALRDNQPLARAVALQPAGVASSACSLLLRSSMSLLELAQTLAARQQSLLAGFGSSSDNSDERR